MMFPVRPPNEYHLYSNPSTNNVTQLQTFAAPFTATRHQTYLQNANPMLQIHETETNYSVDTCGSYYPESTSTFATNHYHSRATYSNCNNNVANRVMNPTDCNPNCCGLCRLDNVSVLQTHRNYNEEVRLHPQNSLTHYQTLQPQDVCTLCVRNSSQHNHNQQAQYTQNYQHLQSMQMQAALPNLQCNQHITRVPEPQFSQNINRTERKETEANIVKAQNEPHPERKHICKECGKRYKHLCNLKSHAKMHTNEALICPYCKKRFGRKSNYKEHLRVHTGETPYECQYCQRKFKHHHSWKDHLRIHTGERPYKCNVCEKKFKVGHNLTVHLRIHSKEKPYKCKICCKSFRQKSAINTHIKRVHPAPNM